jgi:hypothetical protein
MVVSLRKSSFCHVQAPLLQPEPHRDWRSETESSCEYDLDSRSSTTARVSQESVHTLPLVGRT